MANPITLANIRGETYLHGRFCCYDIETTNIRKGDSREPGNRIVCVSWLYGDAKHLEPVQSFYGTFRDAPISFDGCDYLAAWNCKFEAGHAIKDGSFDPTSWLWADPMLAEWVKLGNNRNGLSLALGETAPRYGFAGKEPLIDALMEGGVCPSEQPAELLMDRCARDVVTTAQVWQQQLRELSASNQLHLVATRSMFAPVLADIERHGIALDTHRTLKAHADFSAQLEELLAEYAKVVGDVNPNSPNEMIPLLFNVWPRVKDGKDYRQMTDAEKAATGINPLRFTEPKNRAGKAKRGKVSSTWPEGRPLTNKNVVRGLERKAKTKRQLRWVELRAELGHAQAALSKNLDFFKGIIDEYGGVFFADLMQGITATHRLSGRGRPTYFKQFDAVRSVQGQNMPREFKALMRAARRGWLSWNADGKQLEFRFAMFLGQDKQGMQDLSNPDFDAHLQTLTIKLHGQSNFDADYAALLERYRAGDAEVKLQRADNFLTKGDTFKPLYGGEFGTQEQEQYYKWFRERYSGYTETAEGWLREVEQRGEFRAASGLVFGWDIEWRRSTAFNAKSGKPVKPSVYNYPVQNLATGEGMPIAIICLYYRIKKLALRAIISNTVHDSGSGEVHPDDAAQLREQAFAAFTTDVIWWLGKAYGITINVPLGCDFDVGTHVGEGEHFSFDTATGAA